MTLNKIVKYLQFFKIYLSKNIKPICELIYPVLRNFSDIVKSTYEPYYQPGFTGIMYIPKSWLLKLEAKNLVEKFGNYLTKNSLNERALSTSDTTTDSHQ